MSLTSEYEYIPCIKEYFDMLRMDRSEKTIESYTYSVDKFFDYLKIESTKDISNVTTSQCREYQAACKAEGLGHSSINAYVRPLKALYNWLMENNDFSNNPFEKVKSLKEPNEEKAYLTEEEIEKFLGACKKAEEKAMFSMFFQLGIRRQELIDITFDDVIDDVILIHGKGSKERVVAMPSDTYSLYQEHLKIRNKKYGKDIPYIFVSKMRKQYSGQAIWDKFKTIMKRAGFSEQRIDELHPHSTRHTFLTNFLGNGNDIKSAQKVLGHSDIAVTSKIYAHLRDNALISMMRNQKPLLDKERIE